MPAYALSVCAGLCVRVCVCACGAGKPIPKPAATKQKTYRSQPRRYKRHLLVDLQSRGSLVGLICSYSQGSFALTRAPVQHLQQRRAQHSELFRALLLSLGFFIRALLLSLGLLCGTCSSAARSMASSSGRSSQPMTSKRLHRCSLSTCGVQ